MPYTFFDTPVFTPMLRAVSRMLLALLRYKPSGALPEDSKFVIIGVPHTSNWDFIYFLLLAMHFKVKPAWMGKDALFRWPFGRLFRWMGGIPIDRTRSSQVVEQAVELFNRSKEMILVIAPEGTRKYTDHWKSGFYWIANKANVPICMGFLDHGQRRGGLGPLFHTTGDIQKDIEAFREFYRDITPRYPEFKSEIAIARRD